MRARTPSLAAALFMRASWGATGKGLALLAVAAVKAFLEAWVAANDAGATFNWATTGYAILVNFGIAVIVYFGLLRNTGVQQAALHGGVVKDSAADRNVNR